MGIKRAEHIAERKIIQATVFPGIFEINKHLKRPKWGSGKEHEKSLSLPGMPGKISQEDIHAQTSISLKLGSYMWAPRL